VPNLSRETHMAGTKERISLSMPSLLLPSRRRRKIKQSCLASLVESLVTFPKSVLSERTAKGKKKNVNLMITSNADDEYGNLPTLLSMFQSLSWWVDTGANIHVCVDISMFSSYHGLQGSSVLMGNGSHAFCSWCWHD